MNLLLEKRESQDEELVKTGKMARMLAHEIKNPLARIFLSVDQLKNPDEDFSFYVNMIARAGSEIDEIINNFITVTAESKIRAEKKNLITITRECLSSSLDKTHAHAVRVVENYPKETIELELDEEKMKIALQHIIINAIEATEGKEGVVEIEISKKNNYAVIIVRDNGCGIAEETLDNLFVPFYSTKTKRSGLGLVTARNIIFSHSGKIELNSDSGKGSEVLVSLPVTAAK